MILKIQQMNDKTYMNLRKMVFSMGLEMKQSTKFGQGNREHLIMPGTLVPKRRNCRTKNEISRNKRIPTETT